MPTSVPLVSLCLRPASVSSRRLLLIIQKMGEIPLNRKPSGLAWHPSARIPLLAIYDVTEVTFVQCPRDKDQGEEVIFSSFQPSLPGALECISWSQWGKYLSVCMAGMLRIYNWPSHVSI